LAAPTATPRRAFVERKGRIDVDAALEDAVFVVELCAAAGAGEPPIENGRAATTRTVEVGPYQRVAAMRTGDPRLLDIAVAGRATRRAHRRRLTINILPLPWLSSGTWPTTSPSTSPTASSRGVTPFAASP